MLKYKSFIIIIFSAVLLSASAGPVSPENAKKLARNFIYERINQYGEGMLYSAIQILEWWEVKDAYYVVNLENGWVIISKRQERPPVIAYNFEGYFPRHEDLAPHVQGWMETYIDEAKYIVENQVKVTREIENEWAHYLTGDHNTLSTTRERDVVTPLLTNTWNQSYPYNVYCPADPNGSGGYVYVGCVATAMSMIMHYWRYPLQGVGEHSYYASGYGTQYVNYGQTYYNWDGMMDKIDNNYTHYVALIGYHAAVSVNMMFGANGSGAYSEDVAPAMINYFDYSNQAHIVYKNNFSNADWEDILQGQLDAGQPMYYSGCTPTWSGCHAFVCDGYQGSNYYHFNLGWGGASNGWYNLQTTGGFPNWQAAVIDIVPADTDYPYVAEGETLLETPSGSFTDGSGPVDNYPTGMNASWLIDPGSDNDSIASITLNFKRFNTALTDTMRIYQGETTQDSLLAEYTGTDLPPTLGIQYSKALVTFNSTSTAPGFVAEYKSTPVIWCSGNTFLTEPAGTVDDGSGSYNYNNNSTCLWILQVPDATKYTLTFNKFSTETENDRLIIYDGMNQIIAILSGNTIPDPIEIETNLVLLAWLTDADIRDDGWELSYETVITTIDEQTAFKHFSLYPNPTTDRLQLSFSLDKQQDVRIGLMNMAGQEVISISEGNLSGNQTIQIPVGGLAKGVYLLRLYCNDGLMTRKVILK